MTQSRFDWPFKHTLFDREMQRHGLTHELVDAASDVMESIAAAAPLAHDEFPLLDRSAIKIMRRKGMLSRLSFKQAERRLTARDLSWSHIDAVAALRAQLCAMDLQYGELLNGIHATLTRRSLIPDHRVVTDQMITHAMTEAPPGSRAVLRAQWIKKLSHHQTLYRCDWDSILGPDSHLDLGDPFATDVEFQPRAFLEDDHTPVLNTLEWRTQALTAYLHGDYSGARRLLRRCIRAGFEVPSCLCHLARIHMTQGFPFFETAASEVAEAWDRRAVAPDYVIPRILWFRSALSFVLPPGEHRCGPQKLSLAYLKSALAAPSCDMEWTMDPVLAVLTPLVNAEQLALLTALLAACSNARCVPALDEHPAWRAVRPRTVRR